jgi:hypothetical protein
LSAVASAAVPSVPVTGSTSCWTTGTSGTGTTPPVMSAEALAEEMHQAIAVPAAAPPTTVSVRRTTRRAKAAVSRVLLIA